MQKIIFLCCLIPCITNAQKFHIDLFGGFSNYQGDLQSKQFTTEQAKGAVGIGVHYDLGNHFALRSNFTYAALSANDKYNAQPALRQRNLNFHSSVTEANLLLDYNILNFSYHKLAPYVFGGIAVFHFNPYTFDSLGNKIYLKPLSTEGEGLSAYPGRKEYQLTQLAIPFGLGVRWRFTDNITLSYEIGFRKTFTDYLDDVSTNYVDQAALAAAKGAKAAEMAYRGGELKNGPGYPADGTMRGSPRFRDWYYFSGLTISIGIGKRKGFYGSDNGRMDCPKPVQ